MATDLAEPPGLRLRAQQRVARGREVRRRLVEFHRRQPFEVRDRRLLLRLPRSAVKCVVDRERGFRRPAAAHREVMLRHLARSEEHTSELQSLMRISYAVFCLKKKKTKTLNRRSRNG